MNSYEKEKAQIEQKKLYKEIEVWVFPQSDYGVRILGEAGFHTSSKFFYDDPQTPKEKYEAIARDNAEFALAYQFDEARHRNVTTQNHKFSLFFTSDRDYGRALVAGKDYDMTFTDIPVANEPELTFDDIKAL